MTFDVAIGIYLFQPSLTYHPSPRTSLTRPLTHEAGLLQYHTQPAKTHRFFDAAPGDEFVGDFGSSHGNLQKIIEILRNYLIIRKKRKKAPESAF